MEIPDECELLEFEVIYFTFISLKELIHYCISLSASHHHSFCAFLSDFFPIPFLLLCLLPSCYTFGSDIARSIPTHRCISSISSFCFVKQQFNQCLLFPTHGLDKSWQLPSLLVREAEECRNQLLLLLLSISETDSIPLLNVCTCKFVYCVYRDNK